MNVKRYGVGARLSQAVVHNGTVYIAGQIAADPSQDVAGQTRQILAQIDALLAETGSARDRILNTSIWLSDISTFNQMNAEWEKWIPAGQTPARATVEAKLAAPQYTVEIACIAAVK